MEPRFISLISGNKYAYLWNKYRPVLLKMMLDAASEPQQYKFFIHEFQTIDQRKKDFSFTLHVYKQKAMNNIRSSEVAIDLLNILCMSRKGAELVDENGYEFTMDKQFLLKVCRLETSN